MAHGNQFNISEIFRSVQGEGPELGVEMIFIRVSGCNLRCRWGEEYCDTFYTSWAPEKNYISIESILAEVSKLSDGCRRVLITGGEPSIHPLYSELCLQLSHRDYKISIETNGRGAVPETVSTVVCSPKLSDSVPRGSKFESLHQRERLILHPDISGYDHRMFLKFVISGDTPVEEILEIARARNFPPQRVFLMPLGIAAVSLDLQLPRVSSLAKQHDFQVSDRLHIRRWGNKRGV